MESLPAGAIRALFFDLDGTLLTSKKEISPSTLSALRSCAERGIRVFAATARPPNLDRQLGLPPESAALLRDGVFLNGAFIRRGEDIEARCLDEGAAGRVIEAALRDWDLNVALQLSDGRHAFRYPLALKELPLWGLSGEGDLLDFPAPGETRVDVLKILCFERWEGGFGGKRLSGLRDALEGCCRLYLTDSGAVLQAMGASVSKMKGIERLMELEGLGAGEIAVFGDDVNDREMLAGFPHSVAMGNAPPEIAALARYRCASNDEDGIALALRGILGIADRGAPTPSAR